jgi:hypothetical protein
MESIYNAELKKPNTQKISCLVPFIQSSKLKEAYYSVRSPTRVTLGGGRCLEEEMRGLQGTVLFCFLSWVLIIWVFTL